jgi:hypothetical protein
MSVIWTIIAITITTFLTDSLKLRNEKNKDLKIWSMEILNISFMIGIVVFSHWILDFIGWPMSVADSNATGVPLLFNDAMNIGLGVYSTWVVGLLMDIGVFVGSLVIYIHYIKKVKKID